MGVVLWDALKTSLNALFMKEYKAALQASLVGKLATLVSSKTKIEQYNFLGDIPKTKEFVDEREVQALRNYDFTVTVKKWENTIGVNEDDLKDGLLGGIQMRVATLSEEAAMHPSRYLTERRIAGTTELCYDGKALYADDHLAPIDGSAQDNLLAGAGITLANLKTGIAAAKKALLSFQTDTGRKFNNGSMRMAVICPPDLEWTFRELLNATLSGGGDSNVYKGAAELIVDNELSDVNDWYLDIISTPIRGFLYQMREKPKVESDKTQLFRTGEVLYGVSSRYVIAPGLWARTVKVVNA